MISMELSSGLFNQTVELKECSWNKGMDGFFLEKMLKLI